MLTNLNRRPDRTYGIPLIEMNKFWPEIINIFIRQFNPIKYQKDEYIYMYI